MKHSVTNENKSSIAILDRNTGRFREPTSEEFTLHKLLEESEFLKEQVRHIKTETRLTADRVKELGQECHSYYLDRTPPPPTRFQYACDTALVLFLMTVCVPFFLGFLFG